MSYFKNLFLALLGRDPYGDEVKELREQMKKAEENVNALRGMHYNAVQAYSEVNKQVTKLQSLVEQLRRHLSEKDAILKRMKKDYQKRISDYTKEISGLKKVRRTAR